MPGLFGNKPHRIASYNLLTLDFLRRFFFTSSSASSMLRLRKRLLAILSVVLLTVMFKGYVIDVAAWSSHQLHTAIEFIRDIEGEEIQRHAILDDDDDISIRSHLQRIEARRRSTTCDYALRNTLAHLQTDRFLTVVNHDYPKENCIGFRFFRAADMCIDFDRIGFLVSMLSCCLPSTC